MGEKRKKRERRKKAELSYAVAVVYALGTSPRGRGNPRQTSGAGYKLLTPNGRLSASS